MNNKSYPFRYPEELEKDITTLQDLIYYSHSKNKAIQIAIKIAAGYIRKLQKRKVKKDAADLRREIEEKMSIVFGLY